MKFNKYKSMSMVELMLALGIFVIFMTGSVGFVVTTQRVSLMSAEHFKSDQYIEQGIQVVNLIKKNNWVGMTAGDYGLNYTGTEWEIVPTIENIESIYTRSIRVEDVQRDDLGNIIDSGGEIDPNTKKIIVRVEWVRNGSIQWKERAIYITYWEQYVPKNYGGMLVYADFSGNDDVLKYKMFSASGVWSAERIVPDFDVPDNQDTRRIELYASPTRDEYILISKHTENGQFIYAQVYKDDEWGDVVLLAGYGDNTNPNTRNFDGAYLNDGRFVAVYDDFTYTPKYRIWNGNSWSSQGSIGNLGFLGYPVWMQVKAAESGSRALFVVRDALQRTNTYVFNGSSWGNKVQHGSSSSGFSIENISIVQNRNDTDRFALMFNESSDNNPNLRIYNDSNGSWSSNVENQSVGSRAKIFEITDNPNEDEFMGCVKDSNLDINCLSSSFSPSWSAPFRIATDTASNESRSFSLAYESISSELVLAVYSNGSNDEERKYPKYRTFDTVTNTWTNESQLSNLGPDGSNALQTVRLVASPFEDDIFVIMGDGSLDLYTILWDGQLNQFSNRPGANLKKHGIYGSNKEDFWYAYAWKEYNEN